MSARFSSPGRPGSGSPPAFSTSGAATPRPPPTARGRSRTPIQADSCSGSGSVTPTLCRPVATSTRRPVETMRAYLDGIDAAPYLGPEPEETPPRLLAALAPRMLALAAERSAGSITYFVPPEHTVLPREPRTGRIPRRRASCGARGGRGAGEGAGPSVYRVLQRRRQLPAQPAPARLDRGEIENGEDGSSTHSWRTAAMKRLHRVCGRISMRAPTTFASRHCRTRIRSSSSSGSWRRCFETCERAHAGTSSLVDMADKFDVVVAGAGSAGLTAALSSARPSAGTLFDVLDEERKSAAALRRPPSDRLDRKPLSRRASDRVPVSSVQCSRDGASS